MNVYMTKPDTIPADTSITIEADADKDGFLLEPICDQKLTELVDSLVSKSIGKAVFTDAVTVTDCGLYRAAYMLTTRATTVSHKMVPFKVWVVPTETSIKE